MWRDARKSGICFGGSTLVYFLLSWAPISFTVLGLQVCVCVSCLGCMHGRGQCAGRVVVPRAWTPSPIIAPPRWHTKHHRAHWQGLAVAAATAMLWHLAGNALGRCVRWAPGSPTSLWSSQLLRAYYELLLMMQPLMPNGRIPCVLRSEPSHPA